MKIKVSADAEAAQISFQSGDKLNLFPIFLGLYYSQYCFQTVILNKLDGLLKQKASPSVVLQLSYHPFKFPRWIEAISTTKQG